MALKTAAELGASASLLVGSHLLLIFSSSLVISAPPLQQPYLLDTSYNLIMNDRSSFFTDSPMSSPSLTRMAALLRFSFTRSCWECTESFFERSSGKMASSLQMYFSHIVARLYAQ